ncbi:MAG TPA: inositol monophosphatase family protein, partial [Frankiaceae bacterium]|nr:inositol monophosphatase family protein [Frankiaceae bacterium]
ALWERGALTVGAVALPDRGVTLSTAQPPPLPLPYGGPPRVVASRRRAPAFVDELVGALGGTLVPLGSAGAKIAAVVFGEADVYLHAGGQREWDSAAPVAVARSAGLHTSRLDGGPLVYNKPDPVVPDLLVCRDDLAADVLALVATLPRRPR